MSEQFYDSLGGVRLSLIDDLLDFLRCDLVCCVEIVDVVAEFGQLGNLALTERLSGLEQVQCLTPTLEGTMLRRTGEGGLRVLVQILVD